MKCGRRFFQQAPIVRGDVVMGLDGWRWGRRRFNSTDKTSRIRIKAVPVYHFRVRDDYTDSNHVEWVLCFTK